ncbi:antimicrobial peptide ABC transporter permease SapC [Salinivibrio sp. MA351]|jgi:cationic peptide transport system permease protein|uniref:Antimicrobial peptide ABC transporter permease SapC n=1 Tax=Salinivibrio costicola subsp. alcaliphilus TaxID=272773 RepID=A0ABX3KP62_SALCS|nr:MULTISPECIES: putrescine export ABC transporter permease SapC [Salinivibrio]NUY55584.1 peptide ABC transporter permease SapC [Salinivibrio sp. EAGSL]OOE93844.1 antimicrobial peptide ABC transporter permease SapC [Salinivibrio sp. AR647]OOE95786.1 antimicrobial peptide ABC transporter permease SapC [Salinivibrio sp. AR640]OOE98529.1 antimicrobial peptide ABC transporter permease SapC [Salinivibrio sp. MA351]OOE99587.1 antimicrobial peptide ABC transporter permease SapC [Salinivibrio sp. IB64
MPSNSVYVEQHIPTQFERTWTAFRRNKLAVIGFWCLAGLLLVTLFAPLLAPWSPQHQTGQLLMPPSWVQSGQIEFFLGTDDLSRDMLSRLIAGSRLTFGLALITALTASLVGIAIGVLAGMTKGLKSSVLNHILDSILSIPSLLLAIIVVAFLGVGETQILLAIWLSLIPRIIRAVYTAVHDEIEKDYIIAARLDGANNIYLLHHSILPNIVTVLSTEVTRAISVAILDVAALGFLGLGAQPPAPEWGAMLGDSIELIFTAPWTVTLPGIAIAFSVLVVNLVGEGVSQAINAGTE